MRSLECPPCAARWRYLARSVSRDADEPPEVIHLVRGATLPPPPDHGLTVNGVLHPLDAFVCDRCNRAFVPGDPGVAVTVMRGRHTDVTDWWSASTLRDCWEPEIYDV